jgi:Phage tail tube protein
MKRFLRISEEAAFGVFPTSSPVQAYVRLDQPDAFKVMTKPEFWTIMSGSGYAVQALFGSQVTTLGATLSTPLCYSQASMLLGLCQSRINSAQTAPWTTTEAVGDLASASFEFAWTTTTETIIRKRFLGCKVAQWSITCSRDAPVARLSMTLIGSVPQGNTFDDSSDPSADAFPEPADSVFPTDVVLFQHLKGGLSLNNVARSNFQSITISSTNSIKAYFDESRFASLIRHNGRSLKLSGVSRLKATPYDRATYETATVLASTSNLEWNNGTDTITFDFGGQSYFDSIDEQMPIDEEIYYSWDVMNQLDTSAGYDFAFAYT